MLWQTLHLLSEFVRLWLNTKTNALCQSKAIYIHLFFIVHINTDYLPFCMWKRGYKNGLLPLFSLKAQNLVMLHLK